MSVGLSLTGLYLRWLIHGQEANHDDSAAHLARSPRGPRVIALAKASPIGMGNGRSTYIHPTLPDRILKIEGAPVAGRRRWYERPPKIIPSNQREIDGHAQMVARLGKPHDFVTEVFGRTDTDLGPALLAENAVFGLEDAITLNKLFKGHAKGVFSPDDLAWASQRYTQIADIFCSHKIYNHGLKPESVVIGRQDGRMRMRLFDFKTIVYRQLISPRLLPRGEHTVQMLTITSVQRKFDTARAAQ